MLGNSYLEIEENYCSIKILNYIVETNLYIMPNPTYLSLLPISEVV